MRLTPIRWVGCGTYNLQRLMYLFSSELLEYIGDWSLRKPSIVPNVFLATQWESLDNSELEKPEIEHLPFHVADINTVADNMINEFFKVRKNV